ncbi:MAG: hypothetical protein CME06_12100 [Gemmatimonadetes bacterium]|nr:hypothetical protein [Gemmatimonadota bacterium]
MLSGCSEQAKFERLGDKLSCFENEPMLDSDYVCAAEFHNTCRKAGVQGSHPDVLICACGYRVEASIYTKYKDFQRYREGLPISLYGAGETR